jgi:hypothetical protein
MCPEGFTECGYIYSLQWEGGWKLHHLLVRNYGFILFFLVGPLASVFCFGDQYLLRTWSHSIFLNILYFFARRHFAGILFESPFQGYIQSGWWLGQCGLWGQVSKGGRDTSQVFAHLTVSHHAQVYAVRSEMLQCTWAGSSALFVILLLRCQSNLYLSTSRLLFSPE